ncbi:MAG: XdhC family protein [Burkholderiaceae bacterium]|nr:XdhC family protein [Burkholderiaceae bacterium]MEB2351945.1 XdhC family protein [Burkholderiaceae bacterium]
MDSLDREVLEHARDWFAAGRRVWLVTVVETWGSAPRPPGALLALRDDGLVVGSVSGGCVEDDLIKRVQTGERVGKPSLIVYGVAKEEAARFGLPCGGTLRLLQEPVADARWIEEVLGRTARQEIVVRTLDLETGQAALAPAQRGEMFAFDGRTARTVFGPRYRLLMIGAGQLSRVLGEMARALDFQVFVCDPREEYYTTLELPQVTWLPGMPDDVIAAFRPDVHTAVVALTHDPKLDDLALIEALKSPAFYVGALGSRRNTGKRRERLALFDLSPEEIGRLHGPIGLHIGSRTPSEIAVAILAEIVSLKNGIEPVQKKAPQDEEACLATG